MAATECHQVRRQERKKHSSKSRPNCIGTKPATRYVPNIVIMKTSAHAKLVYKKIFTNVCKKTNFCLAEGCRGIWFVTFNWTDTLGSVTLNKLLVQPMSLYSATANKITLKCVNVSDTFNSIQVEGNKSFLWTSSMQHVLCKDVASHTSPWKKTWYTSGSAISWRRIGRHWLS